MREDSTLVKKLLVAGSFVAWGLATLYASSEDFADYVNKYLGLSSEQCTERRKMFPCFKECSELNYEDEE